MGRRERRARQRQAIKQLLDGPPRKPVCGQAKAAARARERADTEPRMPKNSAEEKRLARERQAATGKPYAVCLAEVRAEYAARQPQQPAPEEQ
ncbi:hypothetical protein ACFUEN_28895 [Streptomyces griseorubiginosus]|uniref:hypothetical protein n=1 Tax=Streptomyces griseorubiginosus TaxID=67304 RepID=UPI003626AB1E